MKQYIFGQNSETENLSFISHKRPIWWWWCGRSLLTKSWACKGDRRYWQHKRISTQNIVI